eukprot:384445-Pleurochrysis_carterae.AAC.3
MPTTTSRCMLETSAVVAIMQWPTSVRRLACFYLQVELIAMSSDRCHGPNPSQDGGERGSPHIERRRHWPWPRARGARGRGGPCLRDAGATEAAPRDQRGVAVHRVAARRRY